MHQRDWIVILIAASIAITVVSLMFGVFFLFFLLPIIFPLALRRRFSLRKKHTYREPHTLDQNRWTSDEEEDWKKKWK
ncbi:MAG: hypothetical protein ACE5KA_00055 [Nitrososphaerales archaeon]